VLPYQVRETEQFKDVKYLYENPVSGWEIDL
jgi:hypothetical protein